MHLRNTQAIARALVIANALNPNQGQTTKSLHTQFPWKGISKRRVYDQLKNRIRDPSKIDQLGTSLCGPASFIYIIAHAQPDKYAQMIVDLYTKGETQIGKTTIKPESSILNEYVEIANRKNQGKFSGTLSEIDWIALGSLKNTTSNNYDQATEAWDAMTFPSEVEKWAQFLGWKIQAKDTAILGKKGNKQLLEAAKSFAIGEYVILFIKAKAIGNVKKMPWPGVDHWVILTSNIKVKDSKNMWITLPNFPHQKSFDELETEFSVYSWGTINKLGAPGFNKSNALKPFKTLQEFKGYFYGFMSIKP